MFVLDNITFKAWYFSLGKNAGGGEKNNEQYIYNTFVLLIFVKQNFQAFEEALFQEKLLGSIVSSKIVKSLSFEVEQLCEEAIQSKVSLIVDWQRLQPVREATSRDFRLDDFHIALTQILNPDAPPDTIDDQPPKLSLLHKSKIRSMGPVKGADQITPHTSLSALDTLTFMGFYGVHTTLLG